MAVNIVGEQVWPDAVGGAARVRLVTAEPWSQLVIPAGGLEGYEPRAGDVWVAGVLRPAGVPVSVPAGWTSTGDVPGVVDDEMQRVGDMALFTRVLRDDSPDPFAAAFPGAVWARVVLRVYRGGQGDGYAVAAASVEMEGDAVAG